MKYTLSQCMAGLFLIAAMAAAAQTPAPNSTRNSGQNPGQNPVSPGAVPVFAHPRLTLSTTAFEDGGIIPIRYSAASSTAPVSPHLTWDYVPDGTVSFALIEVDPDTVIAKAIRPIPHWLIFNIPGTARELPEGVPTVPQLPDGSTQLVSQGAAPGYVGMGAFAPGPYHHYTFQLYALDTRLTLGPDATLTDMEKAMDGHILIKAVLVGRFHR